MKWFKMETDILEDPRMVNIIDEYGMEAYGIYVALHSIVARHSLKGQGFRYNTTKAFLRKNLKNFTKKTEKICKKISSAFNFEFDVADKLITIKISNLAKLKDNYTKDLQYKKQVTGNLVGECLANPIDVKDFKDVKDKSLKHKDRNWGFDRDAEFEKIWKRYPQGRRIGKPYAREKFMAMIVTPEKVEQINAALDNYLKQVDADRNNGHPDLQYKQARTWFRQWKEWIDHEIAAEATRDARFDFLSGGNG